MLLMFPYEGTSYYLHVLPSEMYFFLSNDTGYVYPTHIWQSTSLKEQ